MTVGGGSVTGIDVRHLGRPLHPELSIVRVPVVVATLVAAAVVQAQSPFDSLHFRSIGPAATGGRIHDIEVDPRDPSTIYVATATGGIWKTTNRGTFWYPIFER